MEPLFYYLRDKNNRPMVTVCLLRVGEQLQYNNANSPVYARGVAVCSLRDQPCKKIGKQIALGRALRAVKRKQSDMCRRKEARQVFREVLNNKPALYAVFGVGFPKSENFASLLVFEKALISKNSSNSPTSGD